MLVPWSGQFCSLGPLKLIQGASRKSKIPKQLKDRDRCWLLFEGEKTSIFWAGLIILSLASLVLFSVWWSLLNYAPSADLNWAFRNDLPFIVGGIVFVLIGVYMMKSGVKRSQLSAQS